VTTPQIFLFDDIAVAEADDLAFRDALRRFLVYQDQPTDRPFRRYGEQYSQQLIGAFRTLKTVPYVSAYSDQAGVSSFRTSDKGAKVGDPVYRYAHLWRIPEGAFPTAELMRAVCDDEDYMRINGRVLDEKQNFLSRVDWLPNEQAESASKRFLRLQRHIKPGAMGTYLFNLGALVPLFNLTGWHTLGTLQNITGALNTVLGFWHVEDNVTDPFDMESALAQIEEQYPSLVEAFENSDDAELRVLYGVPDYFIWPVLPI